MVTLRNTWRTARIFSQVATGVLDNSQILLGALIKFEFISAK